MLNKSVYDTNKARCIGTHDNGVQVSDFTYFGETLYATKSGKYFLHCEGGPNSRYGVWHRNNGDWGEQIRPMPYEDAEQWAEEHLTGEEYLAALGAPDEGNESLTISISAVAKDKLERMQSESGESISQIIEGLVINATK